MNWTRHVARIKEINTDCRKISVDLAGLGAKILNGIRTQVIQDTVTNGCTGR